jgi:hypothetical protein
LLFSSKRISKGFPTKNSLFFPTKKAHYAAFCYNRIRQKVVE